MSVRLNPAAWAFNSREPTGHQRPQHGAGLVQRLVHAERIAPGGRVGQRRQPGVARRSSEALAQPFDDAEGSKALEAPATVVKNTANTEKMASELRSVRKLTRPGFRTSGFSLGFTARA